MCFGHYKEASQQLCYQCRVVRSCKRETFRFIQDERRNIPIDIVNFLSYHRQPYSTYKLTRELKRNYNENLSDSKVLEMCFGLWKAGHISLLQVGSIRYWHIA